MDGSQINILREGSQIRVHTVWFYLYKNIEIENQSTVTENRLVIWSLGEGVIR